MPNHLIYLMCCILWEYPVMYSKDTNKKGGPWVKLSRDLTINNVYGIKFLN